MGGPLARGEGEPAEVAAASEESAARNGASASSELRGRTPALADVLGTAREPAAAARAVPQPPGIAAPETAPPEAQAATERTLSDERASDVLRQVRLHLAPRSGHATIQLEPASLGRISIRIALRRGRVSAELQAEKPATLSALERHVPELKAALARQGIESGEFELSLGFQDRPHAHTAREDRAQAGSRGPAQPPEPNPRAALAPPQLTRALAASLGVDTYA
ncbi:MAG TPA: flagellar hook-length control protein FliK [Planctomycetota bacterium]|nr:flagellar hook-length control protein FliK [Planctomycetota bacterium]